MLKNALNTLDCGEYIAHFTQNEEGVDIVKFTWADTGVEVTAEEIDKAGFVVITEAKISEEVDEVAKWEKADAQNDKATE